MRDYCLRDENVVLETCDFLNTVCQTVQPKVDPAFPYRPGHTGVLEENLSVNGEERRVVSYVPKRLPAAGEGILILTDAGEKAEDYLEGNSFWKKFAEEKQTAIIVLEANEHGWRRREIQKEIDAIDEVLLFLCRKEWYCVNEASVYLYGVGSGAYPAVAYSLAKPEKIAAFAALGDIELHPDLLTQIQEMKSIGREELRKSDYPVCGWLVKRPFEQPSQTVGYIRQTLRNSDREISSEGTTIFPQNTKRFSRTINDECCAQLRVTEASEPERITESLQKEILSFLLEYRRWFGQENGHLRYTRSPEDMGLILYLCEYQGLQRYYYVYAPTGYRHGVCHKRPLVMALHGYSCTGEMFAQNTQWYDVAEEKDFFAVFPTAYPGMTQSNCTPLPMWRNGPAEWGLQNDVDDVAFLEFVLDEVIKKYPIDESRVYVTGHSNGSVMTQILVNKIPERFAAAAPVGLTHGDLGIIPYEEAPDVKIPFWLLKGELDIGCACDMSEDRPNAYMLRLMCSVNDADYENPDIRVNGRFRNRTYSDRMKNPMVRFTEMEKLPHAYTTEMAYAIWNEWFSYFRRNPEGEIEYCR